MNFPDFKPEQIEEMRKEIKLLREAANKTKGTESTDEKPKSLDQTTTDAEGNVQVYPSLWCGLTSRPYESSWKMLRLIVEPKDREVKEDEFDESLLNQIFRPLKAPMSSMTRLQIQVKMKSKRLPRQRLREYLPL